MRIILLLTLELFIVTDTAFGQDVKPESGKLYRFIYSLGAMQVASVDEAYAISNVLAEHIRNKFERGEEIEVKVCKNKEELFLQLKDDFAMVVLSTEEFISLRKQFHLLPAFTNETDGIVGFNYMLVVNKDDPITNIRQLQGEELYLQGQATQETPELLINKLLKDQRLPKIDKFFRKVTKLPSTNNVVLPVFFKKAKAALVTEQSLKILKEINPQIEKQLRVIYRSPSILLGLSCFDEKKITPSHRKLMTGILTTLHEDVYGKQLLNLFSADKLTPYKEEYLKGYLNLFEK